MVYMNDYDIERAIERHPMPSCLGKAARFLKAFKEEVDAHSDGWAYWRAPVQAAARLMVFIQAGQPGETAYNTAMKVIKSFYTRRGYKAGMKWPEVE